MRYEHGERFPFRNNTQGQIGVVTYTPAGDEKAKAVAPGEIIHLSLAEQEITARAPRDAKDNPFIEQDIVVFDEATGENHTERITPLTPYEENRPVGVRDDREETAEQPSKDEPKTTAKRRRTPA